MPDITVQELKERFDNGTAPKVIDVREEWEYDTDHIEAENIPMGIITAKVSDAEFMKLKDQEFVVCCRSGGRSGQVANFLRQQGFSECRNLVGGMMAWKESIDSNFNVE